MKKFTFLSFFAFIAMLFLSNTGIAQINQVPGSPQSATTTSTTLTITKPTGLAVGQIMLLQIVQSGDGTSLDDVNPAGWTEIAGSNIEDVTGTRSRATLLYKFATASDVSASSFSFTLHAQSDDGMGAILAFSGVDGTTPFDVTPGTVYTNISSDNNFTASTITTATANSAVIMFGAISNNYNISNWSTSNPGGLTELYDVPFNATEDIGMGAAWAIKAATGSTGGGTADLTGTDLQGSILIALRAAPLIAPNLWASSSSGSIISSYTVSLGSYLSGPTTVFTPTFPGTTTGATYTSAIGRTDKPSQALGHHYWIGNTSGNSGVVEIWGATSTGGSPTRLGSIDMNGASTTSLGFVRLGMGPDGTGWILAGEGTTLYLAKFATNLLAAVTPVVEDASVTLVGGAVSTFQNGDLCISGNGNIYALANDGSGTTQIFIGAPAGSSTTLTKKWDLVDNTNAAFTGSVNGVAFTTTGSLYITTASGLYYIDATTVNGPAGTVQTGLVHLQTGLHDLSSNVFPTNSPLPVTLISFTGSLNRDVTNLNWVTENIQNFSHFEVERSTDGNNYTSIVSKTPTGDLMTRTTYTHSDNLASVSGTIFYYRLKMVDLDGRIKYSDVILVRKDSKSITGISINPNPVRSGASTTVRFEATEKATVNLNVIDMSGKIVLRQQNNIGEGTNSISLNNLERLQPGTYILQMNDGKTVQTARFIIAH